MTAQMTRDERDGFPTQKGEQVDSPSVVGIEAPGHRVSGRRNGSTFTTDNPRLRLKGP